MPLEQARDIVDTVNRIADSHDPTRLSEMNFKPEEMVTAFKVVSTSERARVESDTAFISELESRLTLGYTNPGTFVSLLTWIQNKTRGKNFAANAIANLAMLGALYVGHAVVIGVATTLLSYAGYMLTFGKISLAATAQRNVWYFVTMAAGILIPHLSPFGGSGTSLRDAVPMLRMIPIQSVHGLLDSPVGGWTPKDAILYMGCICVYMALTATAA